MNNAPLNNDRPNNAPINNVRNHINERAAAEEGQLNPIHYLDALLEHANMGVQPRLHGEPMELIEPPQAGFNIEGIGHVPHHYPLARGHCTTWHAREGAEPNHRIIANRISEYFRTQPMHVRYDTARAIASCETLDGPLFSVSLFDGRGGFQGDTLVECRRVAGCSMRFTRERIQVELAARQNTEAPTNTLNRRNANRLPPLDIHQTEEEAAELLADGLADMVWNCQNQSEWPDTGTIIHNATDNNISSPNYARGVINAILNNQDTEEIRTYLQNKIGNLRTEDSLADRYSLLALRNILKQTDVIADEHPWISGLIPNLVSILANANERPLSASLAAECLKNIISIAPVACYTILCNPEHHQFRDQIVQAVAEGQRNNNLRQDIATALLHAFDDFMMLSAIYDAFQYNLRNRATLENFLESLPEN